MFASYGAMSDESITHPDGTSESVLYEDGRLDATVILDWEKKPTRFYFNGNRQLVGILDAESRLTQYEWCACGDLQVLIDARNRRTEWRRDLAGRVTDEILPGGDRTTFTYEPESGLLDTVKLPNDQAGAPTVNYSYSVDGNLPGSDYTAASMADVSYTYDLLYNRLATHTDGEGQTIYAYHPAASGTLGAGELATVNGSLADDTVVYRYDALGQRDRQTPV